MLIKIGIDPETGGDLADGLKGPGPLLVRYLKERCILVTESDAAAAELARAFLAVGGELGQAITLLVQNRRMPSPEPSPVSLSDLDDLNKVASWRGVSELLLLAKWRIDWLEAEGAASGPEIASLRDAMHSNVVANIDNCWQRPVTVGESREDVWSERFAPLARQSRRVFIVDKFLAAALAERLANPRGREAKSGAEWFLSHLARSPVKSVHVASSSRALREGNRSPEQSSESIRTWFDQLGTGTEIHFHIVDGNFDHGRRIAFEGFAGFDIHNGVASFDGASISELIGLNASTSLAGEVIREFTGLIRSGSIGDRLSGR